MSDRVVHCKRSKYDVYVGRPSKWGNPFTIGKDGDRPTVIRKYEEWLMTGKGQYLLKDIPELENRILACWCYPKQCHATILANLADRSYS